MFNNISSRLTFSIKCECSFINKVKNRVKSASSLFDFKKFKVDDINNFNEFTFFFHYEYGSKFRILHKYQIYLIYQFFHYFYRINLG